MPTSTALDDYGLNQEMIGFQIARVRKLRRLTQMGLAMKAHVSVSLIQKVERRIKPASPSLVVAVARALNVNVTELTGGSPDVLDRAAAVSKIRLRSAQGLDGEDRRYRPASERQRSSPMMVYGATKNGRPAFISVIGDDDINAIDDGEMLIGDVAIAGLDVIICVVRQEHLPRYTENDPKTITPFDANQAKSLPPAGERKGGQRSN